MDTADVVLGGFRKGVAKPKGLDMGDEQRRRKPDIAYLAIKAFGQARDWINRLAMSGTRRRLRARFVRVGAAQSLSHLPFTFNAYGTGLTGVYAAILAPLHRRRMGKGQFAHISLA